MGMHSLSWHWTITIATYQPGNQSLSHGSKCGKMEIRVKKIQFSIVMIACIFCIFIKLLYLPDIMTMLISNPVIPLLLLLVFCFIIVLSLIGERQPVSI